jgi:hypothetical protein
VALVCFLMAADASSLVGHCADYGIEVGSFPYTQRDEADISQQVTQLASTNIRVVMCVVMGLDVDALLGAALGAGILGVGTMWTFSDSFTAEEFGRTTNEVRQALHGSLRILAAGATEENRLWEQFASDGWLRIDPASLNSQYKKNRSRTCDCLSVLTSCFLLLSDASSLSHHV